MTQWLMRPVDISNTMGHTFSTWVSWSRLFSECQFLLNYQALNGQRRVTPARRWKPHKKEICDLWLMILDSSSPVRDNRELLYDTCFADMCTCMRSTPAHFSYTLTGQCPLYKKTDLYFIQLYKHLSLSFMLWRYRFIQMLYSFTYE